MKKLLLLILIALLVALSIFIVFNGLEIGKIEVLGVREIQSRSNDLDEQIKNASKLAQTDYKQAVNTVESNTKELKTTKQEYQDLTAVSSEGDVSLASQIEKYEIETLLIKLGNHAKSEGAKIKIDITKDSTNSQDSYNLKFTVNGSYVAITEFISDIENDSILGFKIEEFKMQPSSSTEELQATFTCNNIAIEGITINNTTPTNGANTTSNTTNATNVANNVATNSSANNATTNTTNNVANNTVTTNRAD